MGIRLKIPVHSVLCQLTLIFVQRFGNGKESVLQHHYILSLERAEC